MMHPSFAKPKRLVAAILAHVDAGKTTLAEAMLCAAGELKSPGRVDSGSAHLDTHELERERGITIFSAQAAIELESTRLVLLDTPGHVDFAAEAERALSAADIAILVVSGAAGVQAHTQTLWRMLERAGLPVFIFVSKMDIAAAGKEELMRQLRAKLSPCCVCFGLPRPELVEEAAAADELLLDSYLQNGGLAAEELIMAIGQRRIFPCCFGSGLRQQGIAGFLAVLDEFSPIPEYPEEFSARVYKVSKDAQGTRLTWLKVTGGELKVRMPVCSPGGEQEKAAQLRIYSGSRFAVTDAVPAGCIAAVAGLGHTLPGQALGAAGGGPKPPMLEPVITCTVQSASHQALELLPALRELEQEDPELRVLWNEQLRQVEVRLMGKVQAEVLQSLMKRRFNMDITLGEGRILYKETIASTVEGVGHFEPLHHYAEIHLLLEPAEPGSGICVRSRPGAMEPEWRDAALACLAQHRHLGVLCGAPLADVRLTLLSGRTHPKHTDGGDIREAAARAVRQGLMQAKSVLLEPVYEFCLELPAELAGRAMSDITRMHGECTPTQGEGGLALLQGSAPVATMRGYALEVAAYTRGRGRLSLAPAGYSPCHNAEEVIAAAAYDPERDPANSPDSIFCQGGAGRTVKWHEVSRHMHLPAELKPAVELRRPTPVSEKELEAILRRTLGPARPSAPTRPAAASLPVPPPPPPCKDVFVDGYNLIYGWEELKALAQESLSAARWALADILKNYAAYRGFTVTLVFDAYLAGGPEAVSPQDGGVKIVYTAQDEPADVYIAKELAKLPEKLRARVVTSDRLIQLSALRSDVLMTSAREFKAEVESAQKRIADIISTRRSSGSASIAERLDKSHKEV